MSTTLSSNSDHHYLAALHGTLHMSQGYRTLCWRRHCSHGNHSSVPFPGATSHANATWNKVVVATNTPTCLVSNEISRADKHRMKKETTVRHPSPSPSPFMYHNSLPSCHDFTILIYVQCTLYIVHPCRNTTSLITKGPQLLVAGLVLVRCATLTAKL